MSADEITKMPLGQIEAELRHLAKWKIVDSKLHKEFVFADFVEAFGFMSKVALLAEKQFHHPEWSNVFDRVTIALATHEVGGISIRDFQLARAIDKLTHETG